jgi:phage tail-like protein
MSSTPLVNLESILGLTNRFLVTIDGISLGHWGKCRGLSVDFKPEPIAEGGNYSYMPILPGRITFEKITLTRAMNPDDSKIVQDWLAERARNWVHGTDSGHSLLGMATQAVSSALGGGSSAGQTGHITLCDANGAKVITWTLSNVYPSKWTGPELDAMTAGIAMESLELVHEGFL